MRYGDDHPFETKPDYSRGTLGDGLNRFSYCEFFDHERIKWDACQGYLRYLNDCLTPKGFSVTRHEISPDVFIDIYNLHMDAGTSPEDDKARRVQVDQLIEKILAVSDGEAIIVAGDFNMIYDDPDGTTNLQDLISSTQLLDAAIEVGTTVDLFDKILYRSGDRVALTAESYLVESEMFEDGNGEQLSDHYAASVLFSWEEI